MVIPVCLTVKSSGNLIGSKVFTNIFQQSVWLFQKGLFGIRSFELILRYYPKHKTLFTHEIERSLDNQRDVCQQRSIPSDL